MINTIDGLYCHLFYLNWQCNVIKIFVHGYKNILMRKVILTGFFLAISVLTGFSQIKKNTALLGGYANFNYVDKNFIMNLNPNTGLFLTDRFCLGISFPVMYNPAGLYWGLAPFGRYYFNPGELKSFYVSGAIGVTSFLNSENTLTDRALTLGLGHVWFLNKSIGFELEAQGNTSFHNINAGLFLGFQIYFNKAED
jgi:hypothetical protein